MTQDSHDFGGDWTEIKLEHVRKYLIAYAKIMKGKFRFAYIDGFAGTGYRTLKQDDNAEELMFPEIAEQESQLFLKGSARIALEIEPRFDTYIFIEKDEQRFQELVKLKEEYSALGHNIRIENQEANTCLQDLCKRDWSKRRAVLFLDPYGMQVEWKTIEAIAKTQAIDLWILFPLGVAVNRLLKRDGNINPVVRSRLDELFGATDWYDAFYKTTRQLGLFGEETQVTKIAGFELIGQYFVERLKALFPRVAENPLPLYNSRNNPLYLLCFASGNPRGAKTAVKIAQGILSK